MINDPLTTDEMNDFWDYVEKQFSIKYMLALQSGTIAEGELDHSRYLLAKCILLLTAEDFQHVGTRKFMANLRRMI